MDTSTLQKILDYLCEELGGDWFIAGGALVRLKFDTSRGTEDLDLLRIRHSALSDEASRNALFQWLMKNGLGPEWVNNAMEPFVREASGWENELVLIQRGKLGAIYRPNLTLFAYLKLRRGTEVDLGDIQSAVSKCSEGFSESRFLTWANEALRNRFTQHRARLGL